MKVHIICTNPGADQILPRIAGYLMQGTGWTISEKPDPAADLNYFFLYIDWACRFPDWRETPVAAFFSHKDEKRPEKAAWWNRTAHSVNLRCTCSEKYARDLREYGPTVIVRPPVERDRFTIKRAPGRAIPVVGVAGVNYRDGRKGEDLILKLAWSALGRRLEWRASGRGWAIPTKWYEWADLPRFFQGLDILVCASRIEGIPMPPLEALNCGVKIVIPRGVGMLDELPDIAGIYRFDAGDYDGLHDALKRAVKAGPVDRQALRKAAAPYTIANWRADHLAAFRELLGEREDVRAPTLTPQAEKPQADDWRARAGMYCVAFGGPSRRCAVRCIWAFKQHMPDIPVAFAGVQPLGVGEDIFVEREDTDVGGRLAKLAVYDETPPDWEYILYLDADTELQSDVDFLYRLLVDGWEAIICKDMIKYHVARMMRRPDNGPEYEATAKALGTLEVLQYNGGVFGFRRCERVRRFFERWNREWQRWAARDQGALLRALHADPLRLFVLPNNWNASDRYPMPPGDIAVVHHNMQARRWRGLIWGRTDSQVAWDAVAKFTGEVE